MPRVCAICEHPQKEEIEELISGIPTLEADWNEDQ